MSKETIWYIIGMVVNFWAAVLMKDMFPDMKESIALFFITFVVILTALYIRSGKKASK